MFFHALENSDPKLLQILRLLNPSDTKRFDTIQALDQYRLLIERLPGLRKCLEMDLHSRLYRMNQVRNVC